MRQRSVWAIVAGILFVIVVTTIVDIILHVTYVRLAGADSNRRSNHGRRPVAPRRSIAQP